MTAHGIRFDCPACGASNALGGATTTCDSCRANLMPVDGVSDLVPLDACADERDFYESEYLKHVSHSPAPPTRASLEAMWQRPDAPENAAVRRRVGDLADKSVLLLGNGASAKELLFADDMPAVIVCSDISVSAASHMRDIARSIGLADRVAFAAVDATRIPFAKGSFDVVYGYAMVHHLPDIEGFLAGVADVLAPGGKAVFMDDGYAPAWQRAKTTWLRSFMKLSHRRTGVSPEDLRASLQGGFREADLATIIGDIGGVPEFERVGLLTYFVYRGAKKLLWSGASRALRRQSIATALARADRKLSQHSFFRDNQVRLIWGFTKEP